MLKVKDTLRATVNLTFDGRVIKAFHGPNAAERFANEVRVLRHLEAHGCGFVPRLLEANAAKLRITTNNCGCRVEHLDAARTSELFAELAAYGVHHDDPDMRNVTYRMKDGRFCIIDFELATILRGAEVTENVIKNITLNWSARTDIGRVRKNNEDAFLALRFNAHEVHRLAKIGGAQTADLDYVFAVCDGMGGAKAGEYASRIAVDKITTLLPRSFRKTAASHDTGTGELLIQLFREIHRAIVYLGNSYEECRGMETTLSLAWFTLGWMYFGHVGDSRIYHLSAGKNEIRQLTEDDTHVGWLLRTGQINEREARSHPRRNVLQKSLGGSNQFVDPQVGAVGCEPGDVFLICSDGLTDGLYDHRIVDVLRASVSECSNPAQKLVEDSVADSGRDNTTALVVAVTE